METSKSMTKERDALSDLAKKQLPPGTKHEHVQGCEDMKTPHQPGRKMKWPKVHAQHVSYFAKRHLAVDWSFASSAGLLPT